MSSNKFKVGDVVVLKSNPYTEMTVTEIGPRLEFDDEDQKMLRCGPIVLHTLWLSAGDEQPRETEAPPECFDWPVSADDDEDDEDEDELDDELDFDPDDPEGLED